MINNPTLIVLDEIRDFIVPLNESDFLELEESILQDGCRDSIVVWENSASELIIVDGHHRHRICKKHNLAFNYTILKFCDIEHVKLWMIQNQIGRRNLTPDQLSYYRGLKYLALKKSRGGFENTTRNSGDGVPTSVRLSREFHLSPSTIKRDGRFALGLNIIGEEDPGLKRKILAGEVNVKKSIIEAIPRTPDPGAMIRELQQRAALGHDHTAQEVIPLAHDKHEKRLKTIRTLIVNALAKVIAHRDPDEVIELKMLVQRLERELRSEREMVVEEVLDEAMKTAS